MSVQSLVLGGITLSIFLTVLTQGMQATVDSLRSLFARPAQLVRAMLVMFVLGPAIAVLVCKLFSLHPALIVAIVTLSVSPVGSAFTQAMLPLVTREGSSRAHGLFFASAVLSIVLTPLAVEGVQWSVGKSDVHIQPMAVAQVVAGSVLLPLALGLALGRAWPGGRRWIPALEKLASVLLLVCAVAIIAGAWSAMGSVMRYGTVTALVVMVVLGLASGHWLAGRDEDRRTVLACATVSRHPGVAVAVASLTDQPLAPVGVLLAVLVSELASAPYKAWRKKRLTTVAGPSLHGTTEPRH
ncbi:bile acid:sodium symporter [Ramlibacter sp.]|uniref:bile acid:sodium symporter n=1 Tax=Ramlibacter sp. TaxID=1917967 RepID=UPI002D28076D|nr:bile acid:sodium symporter [Ramlibacter sp.]HYD75990.1 bile acid:sodium symporter [Ramlibacter sp.]